MTAEIHHFSEPGTSHEPEGETPSQVSLEQLLQHSRELTSETLGQLRDVGELAFMELDLAVTSSKWWIWTVVMFSVSSVMAFTFIMSALVLLFAGDDSAALVLLTCGIVNIVVACVFLVCTKALSKKMQFQNFRRQLGKVKAGSHVEA